MNGAYLKQAEHSLLENLHLGPQRDPLACFQDYLHTYSITKKAVKLHAHECLNFMSYFDLKTAISMAYIDFMIAISYWVALFPKNQVYISNSET